MKITDLLGKGGYTQSFEVFPPKTYEAFDSIKKTTEEIAALKPLFMSVTYGAGGGTSKYTIELVKNIEKATGVPTIAHITCISADRASVRDRLLEMKLAGIENVMALRGDIPEALKDADRSNWEYQHAVDLIADIQMYMGESVCIGGACYPEVHPEAESREADLLHIKEKVDRGVDFLTTQMFFDNNLFYDFVDRAHKIGINVPILPGIMPITRKEQLTKAIEISGSYVPDSLKKLVEKYGDNAADMERAGVDFAVEQIKDIYENGFKHAHIYTMNKAKVAYEIKSQLAYEMD